MSGKFSRCINCDSKVKETRANDIYQKIDNQFIPIHFFICDKCGCGWSEKDFSKPIIMEKK